MTFLTSFLSSLYKYQMLGSVIGLQAALQHSPYAFVVYSCEAAFFRLTLRVTAEDAVIATFDGNYELQFRKRLDMLIENDLEIFA